jgi:hypothetical protein
MSEGSFLKLAKARVGAYVQARAYATVAPGLAELGRRELF